MATRPKTPPMDPGALHAGPLAPPRHDTYARSHCSEDRIAHAPSYTPPARQYTANETGACLGWTVDWRNARPCLVGVAVGNLPAGKGRERASNETGSTNKGVRRPWDWGCRPDVPRCKRLRVAQIDRRRYTRPPTKGNASYRDLAVPGPPLGELRACEIQ